MSPDGCILAWIEERSDGGILAAYLGEGAGPDRDGAFSGRAPAARVFGSIEAARLWVAEEAQELGVSLKWVTAAVANWVQA